MIYMNDTNSLSFNKHNEAISDASNNNYAFNSQRICAVGAVYRNDDPGYFRAALTSVFAQINISFDVHLVVDGPIGKDLETVINDFSNNLNIIRLPSSVGLGLALNTIFEKNIYSKYDIAIRYDSDDINYSDRFYCLVDAMNRNNLDLVGSHIHEIDGDSKIIGQRTVPLSSSRINLFKNIINPFNHPSTALNVNALEKVGGYRHCYLHEDWLLWLYFIKMGFNVANVDKFLVGFRMNQGTINRRFGSDFRKHEINFYKQAIGNKLLNPFLAIIGLAARQISKLLGRSTFQLLYRKLRKHN